MAEIIVGQLARQTNKDVDMLLKQLKSFGINKSSETDTLNPSEMKTLLDKINSAKNSTARKKVTTIKLDGKHKINVSVKRKRRVAKKTEEASQVQTIESKKEDFNNLESNKQEIVQNKNPVKEVKVEQSKVINTPSPRVVAEKDIKKTVFKDSGFKITAMPEVVQKTVENSTSRDSEKEQKQTKKKPVKKVFSDSNSNTKYKKK